MSTKLNIGLIGDATAPGYSRLFELLGTLLPVGFSRTSGNVAPGVLNGAIVFADDQQKAIALIPKGIPSYVAFEVPGRTPSGPKASPVQLGDCPGMEPCLRQKTVSDATAASAAALDRGGADHVAASVEGRCFWLRRMDANGEADLTSLLPPAVTERDHLCAFLRAGACMRLLPLLVFLRRLTQSIDWRCSSKRACFIFDDPSLFWPSYGFLSFHELARNAIEHNFYASVATIPLDAWWQNSSVLEIFRANAPRLSLTMHGNDHLKLELARIMSPEQNQRRLAQALRRFERVERHSGLEVCRVMEPPHGAMAYETLESMVPLGYDGALATPRLLLRYASKQPWAGTLGLDLTDITLPGGFPVIPRIRMWGAADVKTDIVLAALVDQPIVIIGHHNDLCDGFGLFNEMADLINSLPGYQWASPKGVVHSFFKERREGEAWHLRLYGRDLAFTVPAGVTQLWLHRSWMAGRLGESMKLEADGKEVWSSDSTETVLGPIAVRGGSQCELTVAVREAVDFRAVPAPKMNLFPLVRKCLQELRDRTVRILPHGAPAAVQDSWP